MTATEDICAIFSILHDGDIVAWDEDVQLLTLTIECAYLARCIDSTFELFYIEIIDFDQLSLSTWPNPFHLERQLLTAPKDIFKAKLEILSADINNEEVVITCNQHDTRFDFCGGHLTLIGKAIKVFDQNRSELTINQLALIAENYWKRGV